MTSTAGPDATPRPQLVTVPERTTAVVRGSVPADQLPAFFDRAFPLLAQVISAQRAAISSPAFAFYPRPPGERVDLEVGFVTDRPITPTADVTTSTLPAGRVAQLVHAGAYDGLGSSWQRLVSWVQEEGLSPANGMWEFYVTQPSPTGNPDSLRTELNLPLSDDVSPGGGAQP